MKRFLSIFAVCLAALVLLSGCRSILIPDELGLPEGLWLYRGNERMRTDGSECEQLLKEVTLDGVTYSEEEYTLDEQNIVYCTDTKTIFMGLWQGATAYVVMYDYIAKTATEIGKFDERQILTRSDFYVFSQGESLNRAGNLFTHRGELVAEGLEGYLKHDFVGWFGGHNGNIEETTFTYWRKGEMHSVTHTGWANWDLLDGGAYDGRFYATGYEEKICVLDLETEESREFLLDGTRPKFNGFEMDGAVYFLTYGEESTMRKKWKLYSFENGRVQNLVNFPEDSLVLLREYADGFINFGISSGDQYYSVAENILKDGRANVDTRKYVSVGEYTFWTEIKNYGFLSGGKYSYLYRKHGKEVEVMQYRSLNVGDATLDEYIFFDDILEQ